MEKNGSSGKEVMFRGWHDHTIDHKGRISIPSKFRETLEDHFSPQLVITFFEKCLVAYPQEEWQHLERKVSSLPQLKPQVRHFERYFISGAIHCEVDKQGRILIPPILREYAEIEKDVVFVGMLKKIEIWSKPKWKEAFEESKKQFSQSGDILAELGL